MKKKLKIILTIIIINLIAFSTNFYKYNNEISFNTLLYKFSTQNFPNLSTRSAKLVSQDQYSNYQPEIAIGSDNITHCVWYGYNYYFDKQVMYANSSDNFSSILTISNLYGSSHPCIDVDSLNIVHIVWANLNGIYYTNSSVNYTVQKIVSQQSYAGFPHIFCDSSNIVHIVWEAYTGNNWDIYYANSSDYFTNNKKISSSASYDENADVSVYNGVVYVVWSKRTDSFSSQMLCANSTDDFGTETLISNYGAHYSAPRMAIDNYGRLHVVWYGKIDILRTDELLYLIFLYLYLPYYNDVPFTPANFIPYSLNAMFLSYNFFNYRIYYSNSTDNFQTYLDISKSITSEPSYPDIAIDSNNVCHLVFYGDYQIFQSILYYTNSSTNFQDFRFYSVGTYSMYPKIANGSDGEIHCVFTSDHNIYYDNVSNFDLGPPNEILWNSLKIYCIIPKMPFHISLSVITLGVLVFLNCFSVVIFILVKRKNSLRTHKS